MPFVRACSCYFADRRFVGDGVKLKLEVGESIWNSVSRESSLCCVNSFSGCNEVDRMGSVTATEL